MAQAHENPHRGFFQISVCPYRVHSRAMQLTIDWYGKAAMGGHREAQYTLGLIYDLGIDVGKDVTKAMEWYWEAAQQGHPVAQERLPAAQLEVARREANRIFVGLTQAAEQVGLQAQYEVAAMYRTGRYVPADNDAVVRWYRKAAVGGHADAQFELGNLYLHGEGVPADVREAEKWYRLAMAQGHEAAAVAHRTLLADQQRLDGLRSGLSVLGNIGIWVSSGGSRGIRTGIDPAAWVLAGLFYGGPIGAPQA